MAGEEGLVVELVLHPVHEQLDVLGGWHLEGGLHVLPVCPEVLEFLPCAHDGARLLGAEFGECSVEYGNLVVEFDGVNGEPFIEILPLGEFDCKVHVAAAEGHLGDLLQVVVFGGLVLLHYLSACFHVRYYKSFKSGLGSESGDEMLAGLDCLEEGEAGLEGWGGIGKGWGDEVVFDEF